MKKLFTSTFDYKLIYVFRINDKAHEGLLKVGDATVHTIVAPSLLKPSCKELNKAAKDRINSYTHTAGVDYELLYTELAICERKGKVVAFRDHAVHDVLKRSGITNHYFDHKNCRNEWFKIDLDTAKRAIKAVKEGRGSLLNSEVTTHNSPIVFRPEQKEAIEKTVAKFKKGNRMLWNAKMRFGKTLSALEVAKRMGFKRTLILTHRPVVSSGWFEDFDKIFYDRDDYKFGSRGGDKGEAIDSLAASSYNYVYFASMQDLRGSEQAGGKFAKNETVFNIAWDFVIIDEAHEGTQTTLGKNVLNELTKSKDAKVLHLSGTPFNIMSDFDEKEIYTWDYVMEQQAKSTWATHYFGDSNPYEELPRLNIFTYNLNKIIKGYEDFEDKAFNFREFFRTWSETDRGRKCHIPEGATVGEFVNEKDVNSFLNLITKADEESNYPYATEEFRSYFRHSLWMVPGVKEARALSALLKAHPIFGVGFNIANVAGEGDEEENTNEALQLVENAIGKNPDETYSITISCGRLTTGVSVKPWTSVLMLSGSYSTKAATYMQTIFRVQTPANINGRIKSECYVFDFAPDRTLKILAETSKVSAKAGTTTDNDRTVMGDFLNFCPVISIDGTNMQPYDVDAMLQQLKQVYTDRVVRNGFDDVHIYNDKLLQLDRLELEEFDKLKKIVGSSKQQQKGSDIDVNKQGFTNEEYEQLKEAKKKPPRELTPEQKALLEKQKELVKNKQAAISTLRAITIRIPLLVYGAEIAADQEITAENFTSLIDRLSWEEFMPSGVSKSLFNQFAKYFDPDVFVAAGRTIREQAQRADALPPTERVKRIAEIFSTFKNPDKETVLTPWRVVNMHLGDCLGGWNFYDTEYKNTLPEPRFVDHGAVTADTLANPLAHILELNSKTGLYPLYVAYSIFRTKYDALPPEQMDTQTELRLWQQTVAQNLFVVCKTKMAQSITRRTLVGYSDARVNTHHFVDLINQITNKSDNFVRKVVDGKGYWKANNNPHMKFNAIVGNPPYQVMDGGHGVSAKPVYDKFVDAAKLLEPHYISMIMPSRWFAGGKGLDDFRNRMLNDDRLQLITDFPNASDCFPGVDIAGGVSYLLWNNCHSGNCTVTVISQGAVSTLARKLNEFNTFVRYNEAVAILNKVLSVDSLFMNEVVSSRKPFGLATNVRPTDKGDITLFWNGGMGKYDSSKIKVGVVLIDKWKVITSKVSYDHAGQPDKEGKRRVLSKIEILPPNTICTETYIVVTAFDNELSATYLLNYIKTKFVRFLISQLSFSQDITKDRFAFVPQQDFTEKSDIDWSKSIVEIDQQLYKKYHLTPEEVTFIEATIKPME